MAAALVMMASTALAIEIDLGSARIEQALRLARASEAERVAFHRPYIFVTAGDTLEMVEVVTELRRLVRLAEARIAGGDLVFASGTRAAEEALRPWRRRVSVIARLRFHPQNAYVMAPPVDVRLESRAGAVPRLDQASETRFGLGSGRPNERLPVVGASAEATFDAAAVGQALHTVVVRMEGQELGRAAIDFGRLD